MADKAGQSTRLAHCFRVCMCAVSCIFLFIIIAIEHFTSCLSQLRPRSPRNKLLPHSRLPFGAFVLELSRSAGAALQGW